MFPSTALSWVPIFCFFCHLERIFTYCYTTFNGDCISQECTQKGEGGKRIKMVSFDFIRIIFKEQFVFGRILCNSCRGWKNTVVLRILHLPIKARLKPAIPFSNEKKLWTGPDKSLFRETSYYCYMFSLKRWESLKLRVNILFPNSPDWILNHPCSALCY